MTRSLRLAAAALALSGLLAGCQSLERRDTLTLQSGDAVAWNRTIHTIDPWPSASNDTVIPTSGRRIARAVEIYESGPTPQPAAAAPEGLVPVAPLVPGAAPAP